MWWLLGARTACPTILLRGCFKRGRDARARLSGSHQIALRVRLVRQAGIQLGRSIRCLSFYGQAFYFLNVFQMLLANLVSMIGRGKSQLNVVINSLDMIDDIFDSASASMAEKKYGERF